MSVVLTKSRVSNALKCYWNYALSLMGLVRISHGPMFVSVEPASVCQLKCPACPVGIGNTGTPDSRNTERFMSLAVWHRVLSEIRGTAWVIQFFFQGEPLLNKDLPQMIREAREAGLYTIVSTNAQALTRKMAQDLVDAGLSKIIISMDGLTQASYGAYRVGGSVDKCRDALRYLQEAKGKTVIELQCLRLHSNEHEWKAFEKQYKALGADRLVFKTAQLYDYTNGHPLMPTNERYSRYTKRTDGTYHRKPLGRGCLRAWSGCVITTTGDMLPCCYDKTHAHAYANIKESSLKEAFANETALAFRRAVLQQQPHICQECWK